MLTLLTNPVALFAALKEKPGREWWLPLLAVTLLAMVCGGIRARKIDWGTKLENDAALSGQTIPPEQAAGIESFMERFGTIKEVLKGAIAPLFQFTAASLIFWLILNVRKVPISYLGVLGVYAWTDLVNIPRMVMQLIATVQTETIYSEMGVKALDPGYPLFFVSNPDSLTMRQAAAWTVVNVFTLAHLCLFAWGLGLVCGQPLKRMLKFTLVPLVVLTAVGMTLAYLLTR